jgi:hypothetical protein
MRLDPLGRITGLSGKVKPNFGNYEPRPLVPVGRSAQGCSFEKPPEPPPVSSAEVGIVTLGQCLRGEASQELRKYSCVHEPCLEVAGAGLDHGTRIKAVCREPGERGLVEIVERGEAMLTRWTNVDVRAVGIAVLEQRKPVEDRRGRDAVESRKHSTLTQDTDIVERPLDRSEHDANSGFCLVHRSLLPDAFGLGGVQGRERGRYETQFRRCQTGELVVACVCEFGAEGSQSLRAIRSHETLPSISLRRAHLLCA